MRRNQLILFCMVFIFLILSPFLYQVFSSGEDYVFGGFLLNPIDGNSYLSKMAIGAQGSWKFTLPYSSTTGEGEYIFLFYIFLGHISGIIGLDNIIVFHIARILSAFLLIVVLNRFLIVVFPEDRKLTQRGLILAALGSGMGWLFVFTGHMFSDFWVAEAFPFLSSYSNPHFTLGMALLLLIFLDQFESNKKRIWKTLIFGSLISIIMPFGFVLAALVILVYEIQNWIFRKQFDVFSLAALIPGGLYLLYQYYVSLVNPALAGWNAQNLTKSPPIWDLLISFSPAFPLAIISVKRFWKSKAPSKRLVLIWFIAGMSMVYFPFSLQRRFLFAFYIPVAILAVQGIDIVIKNSKQIDKMLIFLILTFSFITNAFLIVSGLLSSGNVNSKLFLSKNEADALQWISENSKQSALVLCSPDMGLFIPAYTRQRVLYGHPFETLNAEMEEEAVRGFYSSGNNIEEQLTFIQDNEIDIILYGNREEIIGFPQYLNQLTLLYSNEKIKIYAAHSQ